MYIHNIKICFMILNLEYSPIAFRQILNTITSSNEKCDGEIYAIHNLMELIKENLPSVTPELINSYLPIVTNKRQPLQKRINAVYICGMKNNYIMIIFIYY